MSSAFERLHLPYLAQQATALADEARQHGWTYEAFLHQALACEVQGRDQKALARRRRAARLPMAKSLEDSSPEFTGHYGVVSMSRPTSVFAE